MLGEVREAIKKKKKKTAESLSLPKTLHINQFIVPTFETGQFLMRAALNDLALVEDVDDIGLLNGTQSVSHSDRDRKSVV